MSICSQIPLNVLGNRLGMRAFKASELVCSALYLQVGVPNLACLIIVQAS